ncbi:aminomethyl-transferring glycine dehydrogenase subunit GcvPA [Herpetosiphon giganteus]|uniref:aminomethyl-transferring glycine dehydrogenase subunit GcvPA n=1 Tax=Herpetosiphon giganteus TaxID=2029754 RepID=UPI001958A31C|nr:aminomethyl-transferring glycine dehydrogenase subunit GcvPA [Herpetosiphon giganteus]MBM7842442.1 glycine dehydrogenase subunit 1 [Herpetosiphon giganteus]
MSHYISITESERAEMLKAIGVADVADLFVDVPADLRFPTLDLPAALAEGEMARELRRLSSKNSDVLNYSCFLGAGAYNHFIPAAVDSLLRRSEFYTAYTPYQPEISQGTLQAIFEYQSLMCGLLQMDAANASHYDGATAMAEGAIMAINATRNRRKIVVAPSVHPQYRGVLRSYTQGLDVTITGDENPAASVADAAALVDNETAVFIVQSPDFLGVLHDLKPVAEQIHAAGALLLMVTNPIALGLFQTPGMVGADIAVMEGQPLGIPLSFGGPYVGVFSCTEKLLRRMAGRLVGVTTDLNGQLGYVLTLQTREQHIRREKATSNICTNQGLMALAATIYTSLMGKTGLRKVAELCYQRAHYAAKAIGQLDGYEVLEQGPFFHEFVVRCPRSVAEITQALHAQGIIGGYDVSKDYPHLDNAMLICVTEQNTKNDIDHLVAVLGG